MCWYCKLETGFPSDYSTRDLINFTDQLSVHQLVAYHTLIHVHKIIIHEKPKYLSTKMKIKTPQNDSIFLNRQLSTIDMNNKKLSISRAGFVYRGTKLFNNLPHEIRCLKSHNSFKQEVKKWIKKNISIKPS